MVASAVGKSGLLPQRRDYRRMAAGVMERKYYFPNAFVIDYKEEFGNEEGTGSFTLVIKQKKDKLDKITVEGGYSAT